jgi:hypothetical protein
MKWKNIPFIGLSLNGIQSGIPNVVTVYDVANTLDAERRYIILLRFDAKNNCSNRMVFNFEFPEKKFLH